MAEWIDQDTLRRWALTAREGDRLVILAEADGRGSAVWCSSRYTAAVVRDRTVWKEFLADSLEDALDAIKAHGS